MSTVAQIAANQANSQLSTGPRTPAGRAVAAQNNFRHGLTGPFLILGWEKEEEFKSLELDLVSEHNPLTPTERILVRDMAQSHWLRQRAIILQNQCLNQQIPTADQPMELALYLRYQSTHNRAFYKALGELQKLRQQKTKAEIGFVSQKRREEQEAMKETQRKAQQARREAHEKRQEAAAHRAEELHQARVWLVETQARRHETETTIAKVLKMPRTAQSA